MLLNSAGYVMQAPQSSLQGFVWPLRLIAQGAEILLGWIHNDGTTFNVTQVQAQGLAVSTLH